MFSAFSGSVVWNILSSLSNSLSALKSQASVIMEFFKQYWEINWKPS